MEAVGSAASVSQLVVYLHSSATSLQRLYNRLAYGDSIYRDEATNTRLLLDILQRLSRHQVDDNSPVFPVLISISGVACQLLNLLQPKGLFGINWTLITSQDKIVSAFETLSKKRELLHFHLSQQHQDALVDLRKTIESSLEISEPTTAAKESSKEITPPDHKSKTTRNMGLGKSKAKITIHMNDASIDGQSSVLNRKRDCTAEVYMERLKLGKTGTNSVGNDRPTTFSRRFDSAAASQDSTSPRTTAMPDIPETSQELQRLQIGPRFLQGVFGFAWSPSSQSHAAAQSGAGNRGITNEDVTLEAAQDVQMGRELPRGHRRSTESSTSDMVASR